MAQIRKSILFFLAGCLSLTIVRGQSVIPAAGGNVTGSGGSVSYTIGQVTYHTYGTNGTVAEGVQQPYEISVVTAVENTEGITLEYKVYPNPTRDLITLTIKPFDHDNLRFRLYNLNGILLLDRKIESEETEISLESFSYAMYLLKVIKGNQEIKIFKIIKR
jgi:hypothetical protein